MTEERMIRVTKPEALDGEVSIRVFFDYYRPDGRLAKDGFTINDFDGLEPAPPKDWAQQMRSLEERNIRLSRFIMDWLGRELDIFPEGALSLDDILPTVTKLGGK